MTTPDDRLAGLDDALDDDALDDDAQDDDAQDDDAQDTDLEGHRALMRAAAQVLDGVDRALAALDDGTYGTCEACGEAIGDEELAGDPLLTRCAAHRAGSG